MIANGFSDLRDLCRVTFDSDMSLVIACVVEVHPHQGARQLMRVAADAGVPFDVNLFDQQQIVPQSCTGGLVRIACDPNSKKKFVWQRSKSVNPRFNIGCLTVRPPNRLEFFRMDQAAAAGVTTLGFMAAPKSYQQADVQPVRQQAAATTAPGVTQRHVDCREDPVAVAKRFGTCLRAAREALGPHADPIDIRVTAEATFDRLYGPHVEALRLR